MTSNYQTDFHDISSGSSGSYSAVVGYDLVTGWGSPNGTGLINALAPTSTSPAFTSLRLALFPHRGAGQRQQFYDHDDRFRRL
ncbi:MAG TPA: hypothetical protein VKH45_02130 [Candidatus Acidoferrum sp.]|nr:hypothetical protein [Candidatus Acidoferrum sp.]